MRSRLTTTALCSTLIAAGVAMLAGPASAGDYGSANAGRINHIISGHYARGYTGGHSSYAAPYGGYDGYGRYAGYRSGYDYGYDGGYGYRGGIVYRDGRVGYDYVGAYDLDDFGSHVVRYVTVSPRTELVERPVVVIHRGEPVEADAPAGESPSVTRADVGRPLFFGAGSTELSDESKVKLDKIGEIIGAYSDTDAQILISAYTDASGTEEQNQAISRKRIEAVQSYLAGKFQIPAAKFVTAAVGAANVEATRDPYAAENRRVVISLLNLDLSREGGAPVASAEEPAATMTARGPRRGRVDDAREPCHGRDRGAGRRGSLRHGRRKALLRARLSPCRQHAGRPADLRRLPGYRRFRRRPADRGLRRLALRPHLLFPRVGFSKAGPARRSFAGLRPYIAHIPLRQVLRRGPVLQDEVHARTLTSRKETSHEGTRVDTRPALRPTDRHLRRLPFGHLRSAAGRDLWRGPAAGRAGAIRGHRRHRRHPHFQLHRS